jgi:signal peptidase I
MTISSSDGDEIFTTESLGFAQREKAQLALRPLGRKQQRSDVKPHKGHTPWPVQVPLLDIAAIAYSRVNPQAILPRFAAFATDTKALVFALIVALAPLATALVGREFVSLTAIPSASMEPTIHKGDVLLVEKFPNVYERLHRGDILLFRAPLALREIITHQAVNAGPYGDGTKMMAVTSTASTNIPSQQLFVKRLVGLPGDADIEWQVDTQQVTIQGKPAVGPPRNLCDDEPLRLIDAFLQNGRGTKIARLEADETYVLGDCQAVSIDSRAFGPLPKGNIVGRPLARVWPLSRFTLGSP